MFGYLGTIFDINTLNPKPTVMKPFLLFVLSLLFTLTACDNDDYGMDAILVSIQDPGFATLNCGIIIITEDNKFFTPTRESYVNIISPMRLDYGTFDVRIDFEPTDQFVDRCHGLWFWNDEQYSHLQIKPTDSTSMIEVKSLRLR